MLRWIVVGGIGEPSHELILQLIGTRGNPQLRHGGQKVHELILQLIGTLGNPQLNRPLGPLVLGALTKQLSVPRGRHTTGIVPQRSRQA